MTATTTFFVFCIFQPPVRGKLRMTPRASAYGMPEYACCEPYGTLRQYALVFFIPITPLPDNVLTLKGELSY